MGMFDEIRCDAELPDDACEAGTCFQTKSLPDPCMCRYWISASERFIDSDGNDLEPSGYADQTLSLGMASMSKVLTSRKGNNPSTPPSRPRPDCLKPPKAMPKSERTELWPTVPDRSRRAVW